MTSWSPRPSSTACCHSSARRQGRRTGRPRPLQGKAHVLQGQRQRQLGRKLAAGHPFQVRTLGVQFRQLPGDLSVPVPTMVGIVARKVLTAIPWPSCRSRAPRPGSSVDAIRVPLPGCMRGWSPPASRRPTGVAPDGSSPGCRTLRKLISSFLFASRHIETFERLLDQLEAETERMNSRRLPRRETQLLLDDLIGIRWVFTPWRTSVRPPSPDGRPPATSAVRRDGAWVMALVDANSLALCGVRPALSPGGR